MGKGQEPVGHRTGPRGSFGLYSPCSRAQGEAPMAGLPGSLTLLPVPLPEYRSSLRAFLCLPGEQPSAA